jgi:hypothetical protein
MAFGKLGQLGRGFGGRLGGAQVAPVYDPAASTLFAAMTTPPTTGRKTLINDLIVSLKASGVWASLDLLYITAAADSQAGRLNWKNPGSFTLSPSNSPAFVADRGFTGDGATSSLNTGWDASINGVNFTLNSASVWVWIQTNVTGAPADVGRVAGPGVYIGTRSATNTMTARVCDSDNTTRTTTDCSGLNGANRISSATKRLWQRGVQVGADISVASTSLPAGTNWACGGFNGSFSAKPESAMAWGSSLNTLEPAFTSSLLTYMQAVGAA